MVILSDSPGRRNGAVTSRAAATFTGTGRASPADVPPIPVPAMMSSSGASAQIGPPRTARAWLPAEAAVPCAAPGIAVVAGAAVHAKS